MIMSTSGFLNEELPLILCQLVHPLGCIKILMSVYVDIYFWRPSRYHLVLNKKHFHDTVLWLWPAMYEEFVLVLQKTHSQCNNMLKSWNSSTVLDESNEKSEGVSVCVCMYVCLDCLSVLSQQDEQMVFRLGWKEVASKWGSVAPTVI